MCAYPDEEDARQVAPLLLGEYWWEAEGPEGHARLNAAHLGSSAWLVLRHTQLGVIGSVRAHGEGARHASVMDMVVHPEFRGRGLGRALLVALLDHPRLRGLQHVELRTRDARRFYEGQGFEQRASPYPTLVRGSATR